MNYLIKIILITATLLTGCRSEVNKIPCVGLNGKKQAGVEYEYSTLNIVLGIIFVETVIVPVVVVLDRLECPVWVEK
jgi:hypothetical protein